MVNNGRSDPYEMLNSEWKPSTLYIWLWSDVRRSMKKMFMASRVEDAHGEELVVDILVVWRLLIWLVLEWAEVLPSI